MKNIYKTRLLLLLTCSLACLLLVGACKKFITVDSPPELVVASAVFIDDKTATSTIIGLYSQMMNVNLYLANGALSLYAGLSADEIYNTTNSTNIDPFTANAIPSNNTIIQTNMWRYGYNYIYQANACIEGLKDNTKVSAPLRNQLVGEAKFIRALNYVYLVNLFGNVPFIASTDYSISEKEPRTNIIEVYKHIITDLQEAEILLTPDYPSAFATRVNRYAASALLARVYLYQQNWVLAEAKATEVINSGTYTLVKPLANVFLAGSKEAILQFIPVNTSNTAEGANFLPSSATVRPPYVLTNNLINAFEVGDLRKTDWVNKNTVASVAYYYPYKYKVKTGTTKTEYNMVLRFAEQYLIRAEARIQQEKIQEGISDLNILRTRARQTPTANLANPLPNLSATVTKPDALLAVEQERRIELFCEGGYRWFDLKRTGRIDAVLSSSKSAWQPSAALFPIPFTETQKNPFLTQNIGYQ